MMKALKLRASQLERATVRLPKKQVEEERTAPEKSQREVAENPVKYPWARISGMQKFMEFTRALDWKPSLVDALLL